MTDFITRRQRLGSYRPFTLKIARSVVFIGLGVMFLVQFTTVWTNSVTAQVEYRNAHAFKPVK